MVPSRTRMALCICFQRVSRRYIAGWRGSSENPAFFYRCSKESNVDPAEVAKNGRFVRLPYTVCIPCQEGVSEAKTTYFSKGYDIIRLNMPGAEQRGGQGWTRRDVLRFVGVGTVVTGAALGGISCGNNESSLTAEENNAVMEKMFKNGSL